MKQANTKTKPPLAVTNEGSNKKTSLIPIIAQEKERCKWFIPDAELFTSPTETSGDLCIGLNVDTEFYQPRTKGSQLSPRQGLTAQLASFHDTCLDNALIFTHPDSDGLLPRHPVFKDNAVIEYLIWLGHDITYTRDCESKPERYLTFVLAAHFETAELRMLWTGDYLQDIEEHIRDINHPQGTFKMTRRLSAQTGSNFPTDYITLPWTITWDGVLLGVRLVLVDTCGVHGISSYADFCAVSGVDLPYKELLSEEDKSNMDKTAVERPEDFDNYAKGDLHVYNALVGNAKHMRKVYEMLGFAEYYNLPALTMGSTVKDLFIAALRVKFGLKESKVLKKVEKDYLLPASAQSLRKNSARTACLLSKVFGGRCFNNQPTSTAVLEILIDLDIDGAYAAGQRNQEYPIGVPEIWDYDVDKNPQYVTLRDWLKEYDTSSTKFSNGHYGELVPGLWHCIVSTIKPLQIQQDFIPSWFMRSRDGADLLAKYARERDKEEFELMQEFNEEAPNTKILKNEILHGVITHDILQLILKVCSRRQREELLDTLVVEASMVYPSSQRKDSLDDVLKANEKFTGGTVNRRKRKIGGGRYIQTDTHQCHAWTSVNLGSLLIDKLLANRKCFKKKTPMNTLFKLCCNTLYGDMTSKYFTISNTTVGNNITARCRMLCWYMEKGLLGFQAITDGVAFKINKVVHRRNPKRVLYAENFVGMYSKSGRELNQICHIKLAPLAGYDRFDWKKYEWNKELNAAPINKCKSLLAYKGDECVEIEDVQSFIDTETMKHLQDLFPPGIDVLHSPSTILKPVIEDGELKDITYKERVGQFAFEAKNGYVSGVFHGTSNYLVFPVHKEIKPTLKMRSYSKRAYQTDDSEEYYPAKEFLEAIHKDPHKVKRQPPFTHDHTILKLGEYRQRRKYFDKHKLGVGDSYRKAGMLREFSLSQFTFNTLEQYLNWDKDVAKDKEIFGQSLERFFLNDDGTLDYQAMVSEVDAMVRSGVMRYREYFNKRKETSLESHTNNQQLVCTKASLN